MPDKFLFTNNAKSTLAAGITDTATSLNVASGDGTLFPSPSTGERFAFTLIDSSGNREVCYCSARSVDALSSILRGQEGTTALAFSAGDAIELRMTKGVYEQDAQCTGVEQANLLSADSTKWNGASKTTSISAPSGGADGDIWFQYE